MVQVAYVMTYKETGIGGGARLGYMASSEFMYEWGLLVTLWLEEGTALQICD